MTTPFGASFGASTTPLTLSALQPAQPAATLFNFGTPATSTAPTTATPAPFSFSTTTAPATGFSFGATATPAQPTATSTAFGAFSPATAQPSQSFGFSGQPQQIGQTTGGFGFSAQPQQQQQQQQSGAIGTTADQRFSHELDDIKNAYTTNSPNYRFKGILYNLVANAQDPKYAASLASIDHVVHARVLEDNPDRSRLVPVPVLGFSELNERVKTQKDMNQQHTACVQHFEERVSALRRTASSEATAKINGFHRRHLELTQKLIQLKAKIDTMDAGVQPITVDEISFRSTLEEISSTIARPQIQGKFHEIQALVEQMPQTQPNSTQSNAVSAVNFDEIAACLEVHQSALEKLMATLKQDAEDLDIINAANTQ